MNLPTFLLEDYYDKYEFSTPYLLSQSDCEAMTIQELLAMEPDSEEKLKEVWLGYTEARGNRRLREAIAGLYETCGPDEILVHAGAEEAIFNFMQVFLQPGDHMIYLAPAYQSLYEVARSLKCQVSPWWLRQGQAKWELDLNELEKLLQPNTRLLVINTPHNPTGYAFSDGMLKQIADFAEANRLFVFCDQVYKGLEWDQQPHTWFSDLTERGVSLGVMSKAYGLAGLRIGWIATRDRELYDNMLKYKYYTTICSSGPSEFLSILALKQGDRILKRNLNLLQENLADGETFFTRFQDRFTYNPPQAGPIAFHALKEGKIQDFCEALIREKGVLLLPGEMYQVGGNYFRMGYGRSNFKTALTHLEAFLEKG